MFFSVKTTNILQACVLFCVLLKYPHSRNSTLPYIAVRCRKSQSMQAAHGEKTNHSVNVQQI